MAKNRGDFDDEEGFFDSLMNRKDNVPMPDSMAKLLKGLIAAVVLIVVGLITWAVWPNGNNGSGDVPIIRAESGNYKVEPDDKGGMIIPNKDSTIFETIDNNAPSERKVESLLEDSEQPLKKEEVFVQEKAATSEEKPADTKAEAAINQKADEAEDIVVAKVSDAGGIETLPSDKVKEEPADVSKDVKQEVKEDAKELPVVDTKKPDKKVNIIDALKEETGTKKADAVKPAAKGNVYIQLASVKTEADAKTKWAKLKSSYNSLSPLALKVQKADLGAKGTFYRVQAGPTSADNATSICAKIKAAKGDCIIAK